MKTIKKVFCMFLSVVLLVSCLIPLTATAYVSKKNEISTSSEKVYAVIQQSLIKSYNYADVNVNENGYYSVTSKGPWPMVTFATPKVDANTYTYLILEVRGLEQGVRMSITENYSDSSTAVKGYTVPNSTQDEWVTVTVSFDAKAGVTVDSIMIMAWGQNNMTDKNETCEVRSICFAKTAGVQTLNYNLNNIYNRNGVVIEYNQEKEGYSCTTYTKDNTPSTWRGLNFQSEYKIDTSVYKYAVVDCYYEYESGTAPSGYPIINLIKVDGESNTSALYAAQEAHGYSFAAEGASEARQTLALNQWNHLVFPLTENYQGRTVDGTITNAGMQFCTQDSSTGADFKVYIRSIKFVSELDEAEDITISPVATNGVSLSAGDSDTAFSTTVFDNRVAWKIGTEEKKGGAVAFSGLNVSVANYNYVLVNCYYTGSTMGYPIVRITGSSGGTFSTWYHLYAHNDFPYAKDDTKDTRASVASLGGAGKWLTLVFPILETDLLTKDGGTFASSAYINNIILQLHNDGGKGDAIYISSVTFSANPTPVEDIRVNDEIIYRGTQESDNPQVGKTQGIRFIATLDEILDTYEKVGFDVVANTAGSAESRKWDVSGTTVYNSILGNASGVTKTHTAAELGGKYIVALDLGDVPVGQVITFKVKPYIVVGGEKIYGLESLIIIGADGRVTSSTYIVEG